MPRKLRLQYEGVIYHEDHLNPVRAKLLKREDSLRRYGWSSYPDYLKSPRQRPAWLRTDRLLGEWRIPADDAPGRRQFERCMEERKRQEEAKENGDWKELRRGWYLGPPDFRGFLLEKVEGKGGEQHHGLELRESAEQAAERFVSDLLAKAGRKESELEGRPKNDKVKVRIAKRLRGQTTMSWKWIAERLSMGHWRSAANAVTLENRK